MADADGLAILPIALLAEADRAALLALNNAHAAMTSHLEAADWARMTAAAAVALAAGGRAGFVLAFDERADYHSPNFLWFRNRFERFVYVDRIVVAASARGRGVARALYAAVFGAARAAGAPRIACEVYRVPPNPVSDAFHAALGFAELGTGAFGAKTVRYLVRDL